MPRETRRIRTVAAANAPGPDVEARLLSKGVAADERLAGVEIGTPEGGRFIRNGTLVPLQQAILTDPVQTSVGADRITAGTGNPGVINARTGFMWRTRQRGVQGPTEPFNHAYVQAVEFGGAVWIVTPRPGTRALEPEPGVIAHRVVKTMPPFQMYGRAVAARGQVAIQNLRQDARQAAQRVGRG